MLQRVDMDNLGPIRELRLNLGPGVNVIIGPNDSGKTLLLKMLYVCVRTAEAFHRGDDTRTVRQILDEKLTWTFQLLALGELVTKGQEDPLRIHVAGVPGAGALDLDFSFTRKAKRGVGEVTSTLPRLDSTSLFIPAKEVLTLIAAIKESRQAQKFGFDDPTHDLVLALERAPSLGKPPFGNARHDLEALIGGRVKEKDGNWHFERERQSFPVAITAEGVKKVAILDRLIVNRSLTESSVLFVDEPESFLHPNALVQFLEILYKLSACGLQVILATHSLTALRKIANLARRSRGRVPLVCLDRIHGPTQDDLGAGVPPNPLTEASVALYEDELACALGAPPDGEVP